ncbi:MAG: hypothetical protein ACRD2H_08565 [Terriglobales bacterium]
MAASSYRRAAATRGPFLQRRWYWGDDHLLLAERRSFVVRYRRFFYADLQTAMVWPTRGLWWRAGIEAVGFGLAIWMFAALRVPRVPGWLAAALAAVLIAEAVLGPTADAELRTVHGAERGPLARRLRASRRVLAELRQRAEATQGRLPASTVVALDLRVAEAAVPAAAPGRRRRYAHGRFSWSLWVLIGVLVAGGFLNLVRAGHLVVPPLYGALFTAVFLVSLLMALLDVSLLEVVPSLRIWAWATLGLTVGAYLAAVFGAIGWVVSSAARGVPPEMLRQEMALMQGWPLILVGILDLLLALAGLVLSHDGHYLPPPEQP